MCDNCSGFGEAEIIGTSYRYREIERQLEDLARRVVFIQRDTSEIWARAFDSYSQGPDSAWNAYECPMCHSEFRLSAFAGWARWKLEIDRDLPEMRLM